MSKLEVPNYIEYPIEEFLERIDEDKLFDFLFDNLTDLLIRLKDYYEEYSIFSPNLSDFEWSLCDRGSYIKIKTSYLLWGYKDKAWKKLGMSKSEFKKAIVECAKLLGNQKSIGAGISEFPVWNQTIFTQLPYTKPICEEVNKYVEGVLLPMFRNINAVCSYDYNRVSELLKRFYKYGYIFEGYIELEV